MVKYKKCPACKNGKLRLNLINNSLECNKCSYIHKNRGKTIRWSVNYEKIRGKDGEVRRI